MSDLPVGCRVRVVGRRAEQHWEGTVVELEPLTRFVGQAAGARSVLVEFTPKLRVWMPSYDLEAVR